jgi:hypothetical protein
MVRKRPRPLRDPGTVEQNFMQGRSLLRLNGRSLAPRCFGMAQRMAIVDDLWSLRAGFLSVFPSIKLKHFAQSHFVPSIRTTIPLPE